VIRTIWKAIAALKAKKEMGGRYATHFFLDAL
jgi:hypothetical protein